jgi:hypothetical protein
MSALCRSALLACLTALLAVCAFASHVEARQGFGGFFWSGPYYEPVAATILRLPAQAALLSVAQKKDCALRAAEVQ